jgi:hypothetical protein
MSGLGAKPYVAAKPRQLTSHLLVPTSPTHYDRLATTLEPFIFPISPCPSYSSSPELPPMINTAHCILCCADPASTRGNTLRTRRRPHTAHPCRLHSQYLHGSSRDSIFSHRPPPAYRSTPAITPHTLFPSRRIPPTPPPLEAARRDWRRVTRHAECEVIGGWGGWKRGSGESGG